DDVGMLTRQVARLGWVVVEPEERPVVAVEVVAPGDALALDRELRADVVGRRLPAVVVDRTAAEHLEVLRPTGSRRVALVEGVARRRAVDRLLRHAVDGGGGLDADGVEDGRHQVDRVAELASDLSARRHALRPVRDQRGADAAEPREALPQAERRVPGPRPAPGVVV